MLPQIIDDTHHTLIKYIRGCVYNNYDENIIFNPSKDKENRVVFLELGNTIVYSGLITDKTIEIKTADYSSGEEIEIGKTKTLLLNDLEDKYLKLILSKLLKLTFQEENSNLYGYED